MTLSRHFYAVAGIVTLLTASGLSASRTHTAALATNPLAVTVMNGAANPVPVTLQGTSQIGGSVSVSSLPAVQLAAGTAVGISGTPTVSVSTLPEVQLAGTATVGINNSSSNPVPVTLSGSNREPITVNTVFHIADGADSGNDIGIYTVPSNKRLVIQYIFGSANLPGGQRLSMASLYVFPVTFTDTGTYEGNQISVATVAVNYTMGPTSSITLGAIRSASSGLGTVEMGFSGYLEDAS